MLLTIAIPTYNRNEKINLLLSRLLPQIAENVCIRIIDNASTIPIRDSIINVDGKQIAIHRNVVNIGMAANITRCIEFCETEWLWILGDDDNPHDSAVQHIFEAIDKYPKAIFYSFSSNCCYAEDIQIEDCVSVGQQGLITNLKSFSNLMLLSSGVYNCSEVKKNIKTGYYFSNTFAPQTAILLDYLGDHIHAETVFLSQSIAKWIEPSNEQKWGLDVLNKSVFDLLFIAKTEASRKMLFEKISRYHPYYVLSEGEAVRLIALNSENKKEVSVDFMSGLYLKYWSSGYKETSIFLYSIRVLLKFVLLRFNFFAQLLLIKASKENVSKRSIFNKFQEFKKDRRL